MTELERLRDLEERLDRQTGEWVPALDADRRKWWHTGGVTFGDGLRLAGEALGDPELRALYAADPLAGQRELVRRAERRKLTLRLPDDLGERLGQCAQENGRSMNADPKAKR